MSLTRGLARSVVVFGVCMFVLLAVASWFMLREWVSVNRLVEDSSRRQRTSLADHHKEFLEDQRLAATIGIFTKRAHRDHDAGSVLGPRLRWYAVPSALRLYEQSLPERTRGLLLDETLAQRLDRAWLTVDPAVWSGLDFSWMAHLDDFDFWDLDSNSPRPFSADFQPPVPGLELVQWVKLRLASGVHDNTVWQAMRDVEQLARLHAASESIVTLERSLVFLQLNDAVRKDLARHGRATDGLGSALGADVRQRVRRALRGALAHAELGTPAIYDSDWDRIQVGRCAALAHGLGVALAARPVLMYSQRAEYEHLTKLLSASPECRLRWLRQAWARSNADESARLCEGDAWHERFLMRWMPGWCALSARQLVAIGSQDWLGRYEKPYPQ